MHCSHGFSPTVITGHQAVFKQAGMVKSPTLEPWIGEIAPPFGLRYQRAEERHGKSAVQSDDRRQKR